MSVGVFYHPDFAEKGYITLLHRVKPAYDTLCRQPYADVYKRQVYSSVNSFFFISSAAPENLF